MVGLFSKKKTPCSVCKKEVSHTHKPKNTWNVEGPLCADCYVDLMGENFEIDKVKNGIFVEERLAGLS